jgi:hypothetical protein
MSSVISDITIEDFANTNVISSNTSNIDIISSRYNSDITLSSSILPEIDATLEFGDSTKRFKSIHSNDFTANTFRPEDSQTITFFGNLYPSLDNQFDVGIPTQRWRRINVKDIEVSGNSMLNGPTILIDANTFIQDDLDPTKQFQFQADTISTGTIRTITIPDATTTMVGTDVTQILTNKSLIDGSTFIVDDIDSSKRFQFQAAPITAATTRTFTVPNADTTLVGTDVAQTLTNKTIVGTTNTVRATQLGTTGLDVTVDASSPPLINQLLFATSPTNAQWANASTVLMGSAVTDNQFISALTLDSTSSTTFVDIDDMTLTSSVPGDPAPYLFLFNATCYTSNNSTSLDFSFALNGTALTGTVVRVTPETKERNVSVIFSTPTIADGDVITAQWRRSNSNGTGNITFRTMVIIGFGSQ